MRMPFKYKFILSFSIIEIIFISLIVFFNFSSLNSLSKSLINEKIEATTKLFTELVKAPLIIYDIATIDNGVESLIKVKNVVAVKIIDNEKRIISHRHHKDYDKSNIFDEDSAELQLNEKTFRKIHEVIVLDGEVLGNATIVFEITDSLNTIEKNRNLTFLLVLLEILLSVVVAYIVGYRLTKSLSTLTSVAEQIAEDDQIIIPDVGSNGDEMSVLSKALHIMQERIAQRNNNLNCLVKKVQDGSDELLKEKMFYTELLNQASSVIIVTNAEGKIVLSNKIVEQLTGYTQDEIQGKFPWEIFISKDIQANVKDEYLSVTANDFPSSYENVWTTKNGYHLSLTCNKSCLTDKNGDLEYVITVGMDMTEKNEIDQKIRALLNSPHDSIILISTDETILEINEIASCRLDSTPDELKGKKLFDYISEKNSRLRKEYLNQLISTRKPVIFEETENGNIFKNHLYPILNNDGEVIQVSIFSHDVTVQRKSQKELQKYIKLVDENVMISHTDLNGVTTSASQAFCEISGYTSEELIGKEYNILRDPDTPASVYEDLWKTIQSGKVWHGEIRNIAKDGHFYWIETSIYPDYSDDGEIIGYNAIRLDITSKKLLEELSITDQLTKLYNRRYFDEDNFKLYNDAYGHQMGDDVLSSIAYVLKRNMKRSSDIAFRIGGEEFSAIYTVENEKNVYEFAERIRRDIENQKIEHKGNTASAYVTASFGVVFVDFKENQHVISDKGTFYKIADELLYKAKESGRNRTITQKLV